MERLKSLVEILSSLKEISNSILVEMIPIMNEIAEDRNEIVEEITGRTGADENKVVEYLQDTTLAIIADAETVKKEIDAFAAAASEGKAEIEARISAYPFLADVWCGDAYDKEGVDALRVLLKELQTEASKTTDNWIIEDAVKHFSD